MFFLVCWDSIFLGKSPIPAILAFILFLSYPLERCYYNKHEPSCPKFHSYKSNSSGTWALIHFSTQKQTIKQNKIQRHLRLQDNWENARTWWPVIWREHSSETCDEQCCDIAFRDRSLLKSTLFSIQFWKHVLGNQRPSKDF